MAGHSLRRFCDGASRRLQTPLRHLGELQRLEPGDGARAAARGAIPRRHRAHLLSRSAFDELRRLQFDLETTGLDPARDRIFMVAMRDPDGRDRGARGARTTATLARRTLIRALVRARPRRRSRRHREPQPARLRSAVPRSPRADRSACRCRSGARAARACGARGPPRVPRRLPDRSDPDRGSARVRFVAPGRELIDTLDAVRRHDFSTRDLPGHGLKAVARHLGIAAPDSRATSRRARSTRRIAPIPERVRRYATADVEEVAALARLLGGAAFALARMVPRRYERLADAGAATGVIDPLLVRAYLRAGARAARARAGRRHAAQRRGPAPVRHRRRAPRRQGRRREPLSVADARVPHRAGARSARRAARARRSPRRAAARRQGARPRRAGPARAERHTHEAMSAAMKLVVNSAYGYLGAGGLTRFADVHAANEVTRRGPRGARAACAASSRARGVTLLEADTDGVYFAVPGDLDRGRRAPRRRRGRRAAAAAGAARVRGPLRGDAVARAEELRAARLRRHAAPARRRVPLEPRRAVRRGVPAARDRRACSPATSPACARSTSRRSTRCAIATLPTHDVSSRVRLTKTPDAVPGDARHPARAAVRGDCSPRDDRQWEAGDRIRVYRETAWRGRVSAKRHRRAGDDMGAAADPRDYDVEHYVRLLRDTFAARLAARVHARGLRHRVRRPRSIPAVRPPAGSDLHGVDAHRSITHKLGRIAGPGAARLTAAPRGAHRAGDGYAHSLASPEWHRSSRMTRLRRCNRQVA